MGASTLSAYSTSNFGGFDLRGVSVEIEKAENGFIFKLNGSKQIEVKRGKDYFDSWESFSATFVYQDLDLGLMEVKDFFKLIEKQLAKRIKASKGHKKGK